MSLDERQHHWEGLLEHDAEAIAWMVRTPGRPEGRFVSFDRSHAEAYAARMHGTLHPLVEPNPRKSP